MNNIFVLQDEGGVWFIETSSNKEYFKWMNDLNPPRVRKELKVLAVCNDAASALAVKRLMEM